MDVYFWASWQRLGSSSQAFCSLFPGPAFRKGGLTRAGAGGARSGPEGEGRKSRQGEAALCTRESITSSRSGLVSDPTLQAPRSVTLPGAESGVENREADGKEKLEMQVFPPGDSCKMC